MNDLLICSAAESEYAEALLWYSERSVQVAERFDAEFDQTLLTIATDPERFPRCDDRHHFYLMRAFPIRSFIVSSASIGSSSPWPTRHENLGTGRSGKM